MKMKAYCVDPGLTDGSLMTTTTTEMRMKMQIP